jgi:endonuclease/exonuclease/phosphatase family metal-dependent hydrolase
MRIASLNIAKQYGPKLLKKIVEQPDLRRADVLLLQEVVDSPENHIAAEVASALGFQVLFAPAFQLNPKFKEGLAILSRYPLRDSQVIHMPVNDLHFHTRIRIGLAATVESPTGPVRIVDTHLDDRINNGAKRRQLAQIWPDVAQFTGPCIIGGDFNVGNFLWISHLLPIPGFQSQRAMLNREMAAHGFKTPFGGGPATFHLFGLKLDWIYLRGINAIGSGVIPIDFSDHNSVWVSI